MKRTFLLAMLLACYASLTCGQTNSKTPSGKHAVLQLPDSEVKQISEGDTKIYLNTGDNVYSNCTRIFRCSYYRG